MQKAVRKEKMKVIERPVSLRDTLERLKAEGDLIETDKPVNPDLELTGLQKHLDGGCPMLFNKVKGKPNHRLAHQPVRRHERHQQDVRLDGRHRPHPQARATRCRIRSSRRRSCRAWRRARRW